MITSDTSEGAKMPNLRWTSIEDTIRLTREGVVDDTKVTVWPDAETVEAMRQDLEQFRAARRAEAETVAAKRKRARRPT
jgi:hypothetical protein